MSLIAHSTNPEGAILVVTSFAAPQVTLLPELAPATVMVCGVQAPSMGRRPPVPEGAPPDAPPPEPVSEPFAREAKHFSEVRVCVSATLSEHGVKNASMLASALPHACRSVRHSALAKSVF